MQVADPFSTGGGTPHFPSDSSGSNTLTSPSDSPTANWFGSCGCAAITNGYTGELHQHGKKQRKKKRKSSTHIICKTLTMYLCT